MRAFDVRLSHACCCLRALAASSARSGRHPCPPRGWLLPGPRERLPRPPCLRHKSKPPSTTTTWSRGQCEEEEGRMTPAERQGALASSSHIVIFCPCHWSPCPPLKHWGFRWAGVGTFPFIQVPDRRHALGRWKSANARSSAYDLTKGLLISNQEDVRVYSRICSSVLLNFFISPPLPRSLHPVAWFLPYRGNRLSLFLRSATAASTITIIITPAPR